MIHYLNSPFKEFLQTSIPQLISVLYAKGVPKNFVGEPFSVSRISGIEKILCLRELCHDFVSKFFRLTVPKNFVEEPF